jgi:hypothetical protein
LSPLAAATGPLQLLTNDAGRRWTALGVLDGPAVATVDPTGLVTPAGASWSLDWWIGGDDRWHLPARDPSVRQHAEGPGLIETALRVPGGDAFHRVYAARLPGGEGNVAVLVVEVENRSAVPFALALALRPVTLEGAGCIPQVGVDDSGLLIDGRRALLLTRRPARAAASTLAAGDVAGVVQAGAAGERFEPVQDPEGMAQAVAILPVAHRTTLRALLPLAWPATPPHDEGRRRRARAQRSAALRGNGRDSPSGAAELPATFPGGLPTSAQVRSGWAAQLGRGLRCELADPTLQRVRATALARVVLAGTADGALDDLLDSSGAVGLGTVVEALTANGFGEEAAQLLVAWCDKQRPDGTLPGAPDDDATAVALWALGRHWALCADQTLLDATRMAVLDGARHLITVSEPTSPAWWRAGLEAAELLLAGAGPARNAETVAAALTDAAAQGRGEAVVITRAEAPPLIRSAALLLPSRQVSVPGRERPAADPSTPRPFRVEGALQLIWDTAAPPKSVVAGAPVPEPGGGADAGLGLAAVTLGLAAGDEAAVARLRQMVGLAAPTGSWPARIHPHTGEGCSGSGDDPVVAATALLALRALLAVEHAGGVDLCPVHDASWRGAPLEAHGVPTRHGALSFAIRWHGKRPALLWELEPRAGGAPADPAVLRIPGLDPEWSTTELRGDTLLAEPADAE